MNWFLVFVNEEKLTVMSGNVPVGIASIYSKNGKIIL